MTGSVTVGKNALTDATAKDVTDSVRDDKAQGKGEVLAKDKLSVTSEIKGGHIEATESGKTNYTIQWYWNGEKISGATGAEIDLSSLNKVVNSVTITPAIGDVFKATLTGKGDYAGSEITSNEIKVTKLDTIDNIFKKSGSEVKYKFAATPATTTAGATKTITLTNLTDINADFTATVKVQVGAGSSATWTTLGTLTQKDVESGKAVLDINTTANKDVTNTSTFEVTIVSPDYAGIATINAE